MERIQGARQLVTDEQMIGWITSWYDDLLSDLDDVERLVWEAGDEVRRRGAEHLITSIKVDVEPVDCVARVLVKVPDGDLTLASPHTGVEQFIPDGVVSPTGVIRVALAKVLDLARSELNKLQEHVVPHYIGHIDWGSESGASSIFAGPTLAFVQRKVAKRLVRVNEFEAEETLDEAPPPDMSDADAVRAWLSTVRNLNTWPWTDFYKTAPGGGQANPVDLAIGEGSTDQA